MVDNFNGSLGFFLHTGNTFFEMINDHHNQDKRNG
jgi:hypothetical protein